MSPSADVAGKATGSAPLLGGISIASSANRLRDAAA
ncbi:hypothetical protein QFZ27_007493 [Inquilinus ginsengisoli]